MPTRPKRKPATKARMVKSPYTQAQVDAAVAARDKGAQSPQLVRSAFLGGRSKDAAGVSIQPVTIGTFWLLEETGSPFAGQSVAAEPQAISFRHLGEAAYILSSPLEAADALARGKDVFHRAAFAFASTLPMAALNELTAALTHQVQAAQETMPPASADSGNPSVPPAKTQVSAGG